MVRDFILGCGSCQRTKDERVKVHGMSRPLEIPQMQWESISMDFVTSLLRFCGSYDSILVVVDWLTNFAHFIHVKSSYNVVNVAKVFLSHVFKLHGMPK